MPIQIHRAVVNYMKHSLDREILLISLRGDWTRAKASRSQVDRYLRRKMFNGPCGEFTFDLLHEGLVVNLPGGASFGFKSIIDLTPNSKLRSNELIILKRDDGFRIISASDPDEEIWLTIGGGPSWSSTRYNCPMRAINEVLTSSFADLGLNPRFCDYSRNILKSYIKQFIIYGPNK